MKWRQDTVQNARHRAGRIYQLSEKMSDSCECGVGFPARQKDKTFGNCYKLTTRSYETQRITARSRISDDTIRFLRKPWSVLSDQGFPRPGNSRWQGSKGDSNLPLSHILHRIEPQGLVDSFDPALSDRNRFQVVGQLIINSLGYNDFSTSGFGFRAKSYIDRSPYSSVLTTLG